MNSASDRHILIKNEKLTHELKAKIDKGTNFGQLAKEKYNNFSVNKGGGLGEFDLIHRVKTFYDGVFKKTIPTVSVSIKTDFGYHLIHTIYRH